MPRAVVTTAWQIPTCLACIVICESIVLMVVYDYKHICILSLGNPRRNFTNRGFKNKPKTSPPDGTTSGGKVQSLHCLAWPTLGRCFFCRMDLGLVAEAKGREWAHRWRVCWGARHGAIRVRDEQPLEETKTKAFCISSP